MKQKKKTNKKTKLPNHNSAERLHTMLKSLSSDLKKSNIRHNYHLNFPNFS